MPGGDGTGPTGQGPMTGRAAGYCAGYETPGYLSFMPGRGFWGRGRGRGRGGGRGWRNWLGATGLTGWQRARVAWPRGGYMRPFPPAYDVSVMTREQEINVLQAELRDLEDAAERLKQRMRELEAKAHEKTEA